MLNQAVLVGKYIGTNRPDVISLDLGEENGFKNIIPIQVNAHMLQDALEYAHEGDMIGVRCKIKANPIDFDTVFLEAERISIISKK